MLLLIAMIEFRLLVFTKQELPARSLYTLANADVRIHDVCQPWFAVVRQLIDVPAMSSNTCRRGFMASRVIGSPELSCFLLKERPLKGGKWRQTLLSVTAF